MYRRQGFMEQLIKLVLSEPYEEYSIEVTSSTMLKLVDKLDDARLTVFENCSIVLER